VAGLLRHNWMIIMKGLVIKEDDSPGLLLQSPTIGLFFLAALIVHFITPDPSWMWRIIGSVIGVTGGSFLGWAIGAIGIALLGTEIGVPVGIMVLVLAIIGGGGGFLVGWFIRPGVPPMYGALEICFFFLGTSFVIFRMLVSRYARKTEMAHSGFKSVIQHD